MEWYSFLMNCQRTHRKDFTDTRSHRMFDYDCGTMQFGYQSGYFSKKKKILSSRTDQTTVLAEDKKSKQISAFLWCLGCASWLWPCFFLFFLLGLPP